MKELKKIRILKFEGTSAIGECEKTINSMIKEGWSPINLSSHILPETGVQVLVVMMGYPNPSAGGEADLDEEDEIGFVKGYERCPKCGNLALEVEVDYSARCEYCGHISSDIRKEIEKEDYVY